tara:strand:- start:3056 stop:4570 length:1515 start_codon:yes stop_codon:yes gene_type:complete
MSVLDRKMFATGDVAGNPFVDPYDEFEPYQLNFTIEPKGEGFVAVQRNPRGEVVKETPINTALSVTGDPVEAYQVQTKNEALRAIKDTGIGIAGLYGGRSLAKPIFNRLSPMLTKAVTSNRFLNPFTSKKLPGVATPGRKGFQPLDPTKLSSYQIGLKPGAKFGLFSGLGLGGLTAAQTTEEEVAEELRKLEEEQGSAATKKQEVKDKAAIDPYFGGISDEEIDKVLGVSQDKINKEVEGQDQINQDASLQITGDFQDRMLDDKNLNRLLRETGVKLVEEGRFSGIASGAASAASLRAAEESAENLAKSQPSEFEEFLAKEKIKNTSPDKIAKQTNDLAQSVSDYEQGQVTLQMFNSVKEIMQKSDITGFRPITSSLFNKAKGFINPNIPLTPRERAVVILEQIANGNIKTITGESGRTISNVDRQIARQLVGDLKNPLTRETEVLEKINTQINSVNQRTQKALNEYKATSLFFTQNGLPVPLAPQTFAFDTTSKEGRIRLKIQ